MAHSSIPTLPLFSLTANCEGHTKLRTVRKKNTHTHARRSHSTKSLPAKVVENFSLSHRPPSDPTVIYIPHSLIVFLQNTHISFGFIHLLCFTNDGDAFTALTATLSLILHHRLLLRRFVISKILYYSVTFVFLSSLDFDKYF